MARKQGHQEVAGETIACFEFWQKEWQPFNHFTDVDQVDLLLRRRTGKKIDYREIQVKYSRLYPAANYGRWRGQLFSHFSWLNLETDEFADHRPGLFVAVVLGGIEGLDYNKDFFIFSSKQFHSLIQQAPLFKPGVRDVSFAQGLNGGSWYMPTQRNRFAELTPETVVDVTNARRNFAVLDEP